MEPVGFIVRWEVIESRRENTRHGPFVKRDEEKGRGGKTRQNVKLSARRKFLARSTAGSARFERLSRGWKRFSRMLRAREREGTFASRREIEVRAYHYTCAYVNVFIIGRNSWFHGYL